MGRAAMEPRIGELRETSPCASSYPLVFRQCTHLGDDPTGLQLGSPPSNASAYKKEWQSLTLSKLRYKLFLLPGELTRPQNRPVLRLRESSILQQLADDILTRISRSTRSRSEIPHFHAGFRLT